MAYVLGVIAFALAILVSVSLHEAGHMGAAKAYGMRVTRYFIGFGPTVWSFRRGETEYGLKALPLGGFVKITGMTPQEEEEEQLDEADKKRSFWRRPLRQRTVVMVAGVTANVLLGFVILWALASFAGVTNPDYTEAAEETSAVRIYECLGAEDPEDENCDAEHPASPAAESGLQTGDQILAIGGEPIEGEQCVIDSTSAAPPTTWNCMVLQIRELEAGESAEFEVLRDGQEQTLSIAPRAVQTPQGEVAQIGISPYIDPSIETTKVYGPVAGIGGAAELTVDMGESIARAIPKIPAKIPAVWNSIMGEERDPETPISVVGASRLGGEMVENDMWVSFFMLLAILNYFLAVLNLLPLLPFDGGHVAIAVYQKSRSAVARWRHKPDPGPVDYMKLMPLTYAVIAILGVFTLLVITADVVNPIRINP